MTSLANSNQWWARAQQVIPLGTQTLSKSPTQFPRGVAPIFLSRGEGARVWDVDGNEYLDYVMGLGPILLGYCDERINRAITSQLSEAILLSLPHPLEVQVAEKIVDICPGVEAVRFAKSGSDAVSAAVRAARALTGRDSVAVAGYHGWHDWYIGSTSRSLGVPESVRNLTIGIPFNSEDSVREVLLHEDLAAIVVEPSGASLPSRGFLQKVSELTKEHGSLLIFDEVITGFRVAPGGARERYGVIPDLSCYGKALGNGMPISAVAGSWSAMKIFEDIFFSGTHGGELLSLAAARAVLEAVADGEIAREVEKVGEYLRRGLETALARDGIPSEVCSVSGEPHRLVMSFGYDRPLVLKTWIQQVFVEHGILFNGGFFLSAAHRLEDIDRTIEVFESALTPLAHGRDIQALLRGPVVEEVFRQP